MKLKASIISSHLYTDALIRQLWYWKRGKSRLLACHFPDRKEAFRLTPSELQDEEERHLLYTETEIISHLSSPALAEWEGEKGLSKQNPARWILNNCDSIQCPQPKLVLYDYMINMIKHIAGLSCYLCRFYDIWFLQITWNLALMEHSRLTPLYKRSRPLSLWERVCQATICSHVAFQHVCIRLREQLYTCCEKCCLNILWYKYAKWFVMGLGASWDFHINVLSVIPMFPLSVSPRAGRLFFFFF